MLALISAWLGLASLGLALLMVLYRPTMTDVTVTLVVYFGSPGALCLAGLVLWVHRKEDASDPGIRAQRLQARFALVLAVLAAALAYGLIIKAHKIVRIEPSPRRVYNSLQRPPPVVAVDEYVART